MIKDNTVYIRHIIEAIALIQEFVASSTIDSFVDDEKTASAVAYQVQVIGEAASKIDQPFREQYPTIPWQDAIDTRHKIVHHYMEIDPEILWDITQRDLPELKRNLQSILNTET
jgi:uncharacterized protein with HEPN domain